VLESACWLFYCMYDFLLLCYRQGRKAQSCTCGALLKKNVWNRVHWHQARTSKLYLVRMIILHFVSAELTFLAVHFQTPVLWNICAIGFCMCFESCMLLVYKCSSDMLFSAVPDILYWQTLLHHIALMWKRNCNRLVSQKYTVLCHYKMKLEIWGWPQRAFTWQLKSDEGKN